MVPNLRIYAADTYYDATPKTDFQFANGKCTGTIRRETKFQIHRSVLKTRNNIPYLSLPG